MKKIFSEVTEEEKKDMPLYPIGVVAELKRKGKNAQPTLKGLSHAGN
jgi:hypothetical protein